MKVLINTPKLSLPGGVANHYLGLEPFWNIDVKYNTVGKRIDVKGTGKYWLPFDILKYIFRILAWRPDAVILNPSLDTNAMKRDLIFLRISNLFKKKIFLFIHGWDENFSRTIDKERLSASINKATGILVLANAFKSDLISWGVKKPIFVTTTKVDDRLLTGYDIGSRKNKIETILFLSRIEHDKGINITVDTFRILKRKHLGLKLNIVGSGEALEEIKNKVTAESLKDVFFFGFLQNDDLKQAFKNSDIYILPSYHEGLPTSVLEAMAFGLPVITRKVGGLVDFFENGKMGFITDSYDAEEFASFIETLACDPLLMKEISNYNHNYAKNRFMASKVVTDIELILKNSIGSN